MCQKRNISWGSPGRQNEPDCFQLISKEELEALSENRTHVSYLKGETLFKQGAFAPHVLFIQSGLVKVYLQSGPKKVQNLWIARSGDFLAFSSMFGEKVLSLLGHGPERCRSADDRQGEPEKASEDQF